ncbi:MAG: UvrD-helicase domain-containing protein [Candidatus Pacearchaeota archaeon]
MEKKTDSLGYLKILKALIEIPFSVGKNLLVDFLVGNYKNASITKNRLDELQNFGSLNWEKEKVHNEINNLIANGMIEQRISDYNRFVKVLRITIKGQNEIVHQTLTNKKLKYKLNFSKSLVTEEERDYFKSFGSFLKKYNDEQRKAIVSQSKRVLCVAGAGSGKTSVLIKRIEFLVKHKNISPNKILAITFTRKAKKEMEKRLKNINIEGINVHTFNSFCEEILRKYGHNVYGKPVRVITYADKILAMNISLSALGIDMEEAVNEYFSKKQKEFKTPNQLISSFMNDCFSVIEYFKVTGENYDFSKGAEQKDKQNAKMVYQISRLLKDYMDTQGLRDFTDQLIDAINFLEKNKIFIPKFEHILVDEYQDVNAMQVKLLKLLNPENLFSVGDPRQAIFGWRGSDIKYILNFEDDFGRSEVIHLSKNYRSLKEIVEFMNHSIKDLGLPDLQNHRQGSPKITLLGFDSEEEEKNYVIKEILNSNLLPTDIFVLARTNRQVIELSKIMVEKKIPHTIKTDELKEPNEFSLEGVLLATIHSIKGLQAKKVFVVGCNDQNFPCKANDNPAIELIKSNDYDREEEEKRLFYVAISRARDCLHLTYSGKKPTYFINEDMKKLISS